MKGKVFVSVLLGLMLLGTINMVFSEEQPKPQARERFVLKDIQPVGDESNGRVPLMGVEVKSESSIDGFTTEGRWRYIAFQPSQSFKDLRGYYKWDEDISVAVEEWSDGIFTLCVPRGKDPGIFSQSPRFPCVSSVGSGYRWETIYESGFFPALSPLRFGHGVEHVI
jgi:hypothetical protein